MSDLRLYDYVASANCYKVRLLLYQLERSYERIPIDIFAGDTLAENYGRINPFRSTPVLEVAPGKYLIESNAILFYLAEGTSFLPPDSIERAEAVRWLIYEQTDVMPMTGGLRFRLMTGRLEPGDQEAIRRRKGGEEVLAFLDHVLADGEFLVGGRYSIADISVYGYVHVAGEAGFDMNRWPAVQAWLRRIAAQRMYMNDLEPYPPNAWPGAGRSIYDPGES
jgi:glutathione S-transferase